jgi:hypothetical protein
MEILTLNTMTARGLAPLSAAAVAAMGAALLTGRNDGNRMTTPYNHGSALRSALTCNTLDAETLLDAAAIDTTLQFGVRLGEFAIMGYTPRCVVVGFTASHVKDTQVITPAVRAYRDPLWALAPWGGIDDWDVMFDHFAHGVAALLNEQWAAAIAPLQQAAIWTQNIAAREQIMLRRALAANIGLAVRYSHGG